MRSPLSFWDVPAAQPTIPRSQPPQKHVRYLSSRVVEWGYQKLIKRRPYGTPKGHTTTPWPKRRSTLPYRQGRVCVTEVSSLTPSERNVFVAASIAPLYSPPACSLTLIRSRGCPTITRHIPDKRNYVVASRERQNGGSREVGQG